MILRMNFVSGIIISTLICVIFACNNKVKVQEFSKSGLYYLDNSDTLKSISVSNQKIVSNKLIPSNFFANISSDGKNLLFGKRERGNDSEDKYNIHILNIFIFYILFFRPLVVLLSLHFP